MSLNSRLIELPRATSNALPQTTSQRDTKQNETQMAGHEDISDITEYLKYKGTAVCTRALLPIAWGAPAATFGLLRGVSAGWIGRMPDIGWGWVWPALGRCRGAIEVSMVGTGSVSLTERRVNLKVGPWVTVNAFVFLSLTWLWFDSFWPLLHWLWLALEVLLE